MEATGHSQRMTYSILGSSILHAGMVLAVLFIHFVLPEPPPRETIQIEIQDTSAALEALAPQAPKIREVPTDQNSKIAAPAPKIREAEAKPSVKEKPVVLPAKNVVSHKLLAAQKVAPRVLPSKATTPSFDDDDASAPAEAKTDAAEEMQKALAAPAVAEASADLDDSAIDEDLARADQEATKAVQAKGGADLKEVDDVIDQSEVLAAKAKAQEQAEAAELAKAQAERRAQEKADLEKARQARAKAQAEERAREQADADAKAAAKAKAQEQAAAEADARYQKARAAAMAAAAETAQKRQQEAAEAMSEADQATQDAEKSVDGEAANALAQEKAHGDAMAAAAAAAAAADEAANRKASAGGDAASATEVSHVRNLEDLKQMPGNKHPSYEEEDRLAGRKGNVVFYAFISKEGTPTQFKMVQSSGHRNLDFKTLKAIREWRFYPGQEGWVEIPFQWDLKGEPTLIRGTLRKVSQK